MKTRRNWSRWIIASRARCSVFFVFAFGVPMWAVFMFDAASKGNLVFPIAFGTAILCALGGAVLGALLWRSIFKPLVDQYNLDDQSPNTRSREPR